MKLLYGHVKNHVTHLLAQPFDLYLVQTIAAEQYCGIVATIQIASRHRLLGDGRRVNS